MSISPGLKHFAVIALFAFLGGMTMNYLLFIGSSRATGNDDAPPGFFSVFDKKNAKGIEAYVYDGQPVQNFYGPNGKVRIQMGLYTAQGEAGLPLLGLSDNQGQLKMLFRLAGKNESPVIIMKDNLQRDRIVMGLGLNDGVQEPFLATYDKDGQKTVIFGNY